MRLKYKNWKGSLKGQMSNVGVKRHNKKQFLKEDREKLWRHYHSITVDKDKLRKKYQKLILQNQFYERRIKQLESQNKKLQKRVTGGRVTFGKG